MSLTDSSVNDSSQGEEGAASKSSHPQRNLTCQHTHPGSFTADIDAASQACKHVKWIGKHAGQEQTWRAARKSDMLGTIWATAGTVEQAADTL
jgi:hypothetical protein